MSSLAVITGATSGIGEAFAYELAKFHTELWLIGRREKVLQNVAASIRTSYPIEVRVMLLDLAEANNINYLAKEMEARSDLRTLVNNAGYSKDGSFEQMEFKDHQDIMNVHVQATLQLSFVALRIMKANNSGDIINVASVASWMPTPTSPLYGPTKAYLRSLSETLAAHYMDSGIRIQALCPGFTITDFHERIGLDPKRFYKKHGLFKSWTSTYTVQASLADLQRGKVVSVPGWNYKLITFLLRILPINILLKLSRNRSHRKGIRTPTAKANQI